jgi:ABC-type Na+ efflux pump permease subunit
MSGSLRVLAPIGELALVSSGLYLSKLGYHLVVDPLYGSAAVSKYLDAVVAVALIPALFLDVPTQYSLSALASLLYYVPITAYWTAAYSARWGKALVGPLLTHAIVFWPVVALALASAQSWKVS